MNLKLVLEYDGTAFSGWQAQAGRRTVEHELRSALRAVTGLDHPVQGAGRTDSGAHALGQVVNFRYEGRLTAARLRGALNATLPPDVRVVEAEPVADGFHARYSARWRHYRYLWLARPAPPAIGRGHCWHVPAPLDVGAMTEAAGAIAGRHDWTTFCSAAEPARDRVRTVRTATVTRRGRLISFDIVGEGFLRGMIRSLAGGLTDVGGGGRPPGWMAEAIAARDRAQAPRTAPARGLFLVRVVYDDDGIE